MTGELNGRHEGISLSDVETGEVDFLGKIDL